MRVPGLNILRGRDLDGEIVELRADGIGQVRHRSNERETHGGSDEAVFDRRRTGLVLNETHKLVHIKLHLVYSTWFSYNGASCAVATEPLTHLKADPLTASKSQSDVQPTSNFSTLLVIILNIKCIKLYVFKFILVILILIGNVYSIFLGNLKKLRIFGKSIHVVLAIDG